MGLSEPLNAFLRAQRLRAAAYDAGVYTLRDGEGFQCECGWEGLSAPMAEDDFSDAIVECPDCGKPQPETGERSIEPYKRFGYPYNEFPKDLDTPPERPSPEEYIDSRLDDEIVALVVSIAFLGLFEDDAVREMYEEEYEQMVRQFDDIEAALAEAESVNDLERADVGLTRNQLARIRDYVAGMTNSTTE